MQQWQQVTFNCKSKHKFWSNSLFWYYAVGKIMDEEVGWVIGGYDAMVFNDRFSTHNHAADGEGIAD